MFEKLVSQYSDNNHISRAPQQRQKHLRVEVLMKLIVAIPFFNICSACNGCTEERQNYRA